MPTSHDTPRPPAGGPARASPAPPVAGRGRITDRTARHMALMTISGQELLWGSRVAAPPMAFLEAEQGRVQRVPEHQELQIAHLFSGRGRSDAQPASRGTGSRRRAPPHLAVAVGVQLKQLLDQLLGLRATLTAVKCYLVTVCSSKIEAPVGLSPRWRSRSPPAVSHGVSTG